MHRNLDDTGMDGDTVSDPAPSEPKATMTMRRTFFFSRRNPPSAMRSCRLAEGGELLAVTQRFDDMEAADAILTVEIGKRARHS